MAGPKAFPKSGRAPVGDGRSTTLAHPNALVLLAAIAVPLRRALLQVANETLVRGAVQDELRRLVPQML